MLDHLRALAPDGISVFFDLVGGEQFEAAVQTARPQARFAVAGGLATQLGDALRGRPRLDVMTAIAKDLLIRPFALTYGRQAFREWPERFGQWLREGRIVYPSTVIDGGIEQAPQALIDLVAGRHRGNVTVTLS
ncbi:MAG: zinc-binding dehydrogenase [Kutzneria sp.]|nr:zinc-binding dehydrogenase [Kutzneria sp.]